MGYDKVIINIELDFTSKTNVELDLTEKLM